MDIISINSDKTFPNEEKELDEIAAICDEIIRSIDWAKIKSEIKESDFEEDDIEEDYFNR